MQIEREEYLTYLKEQIDSTSNPKTDKGNGFYGRDFGNLSKNSILIDIPRNRSGTLSLNTLELLKINREKLDEVSINLELPGKILHLKNAIYVCFAMLSLKYPV